MILSHNRSNRSIALLCKKENKCSSKLKTTKIVLETVKTIYFTIRITNIKIESIYIKMILIFCIPVHFLRIIKPFF